MARNGERSAKNTVLGVLALILAVAVLFGSGVLGWFMHLWIKGEEAPKEPSASLDGGGMTVTDTAETGGMALMSAAVPIDMVPAGAESAQTVTATLYDDAHKELDKLSKEQIRLEYTLSWNAENGAEIVTDYISVTPAGDTFSAEVACLKPFGKQIKLHVAVKGQARISADVLLDYKQKYDHLMVVFTTGNFQMMTYEHTGANKSLGGVFIDYPCSEILNRKLSDEVAVIFRPVGKEGVYSIPLVENGNPGDFECKGFWVKSELPDAIETAGGTPYRDWTTPVQTHVERYSLAQLLGTASEGSMTEESLRAAIAENYFSSKAVSFKIDEVKLDGVTVEENVQFGIFFNAASLTKAANAVEVDKSEIVF